MDPTLALTQQAPALLTLKVLVAVQVLIWIL